MSTILTILPFFAAAVIIYYFPRVDRRDWPLRLGMGMYLGGALGNLVDRLNQGYVTDFISLGKLPVFNIADSSISLAVVLLFFGLIRHEKRQASQQALADSPIPETPEQEPSAPAPIEDNRGE